MRRISPQSGPQERFLSCPADIAIYGGAAGGGKSFGLLMDPLRFAHVPGFTAVLFRLTYGDITNPGGLWEESDGLYPLAGGLGRESALKWDWTSGASIQMSHFQHPKYKANWQGSQICMIGWDELTHFRQDIFFYMLSRNRSICGVRPYVRCTCNPDPDSWVREFISWWIDDRTGYPIPERAGKTRWFIRQSGEIMWYSSRSDVPAKLRALAKSVCFIPAKLSDNPALTKKDPGYLANLMALPTHERERLLGGNWNIRLMSGDLFKSHWFEVVDVAPQKGMVVRAWDRAATEPSEQNPDPDWTAGVKIRKTPDGIYYVEDVQRFRGRPAEVRQRIRNVATADGKECKIVLEEDPGQAGKSDVDALVKYLSGFDVSTDKVTKNKTVRARPYSAQCEAGNVKLVRGPWNRTYLSELESFPSDGVHDDQVDGSSCAFNKIELAMEGVGIRWA